MRRWMNFEEHKYEIVEKIKEWTCQDGDLIGEHRH